MKKDSGFSLVEFMIAVVVATAIGLVVTLFAREMISLNYSAQSSMTAALEGRKVLSTMVSELRSTVPSALGSYPIESTATSSIVFFADVNSDGVADRVRYFLDTASLSVKRGVTLATGEPPAYTESETISTLVTSVANGTSTPLFDFYDGNYSGTQAALSWPMNLASIRLVKITVNVEKDSNRAPTLTVLTSQAALRNLKDNL